MDNFHYRNPLPQAKNQKSAKLMQELQMITKQIQEDNKKLAQKRKLEEEFYEDNNKLNLADEIMNELLSKNPLPKNNNDIHQIRQQQIVPAYNNRMNSPQVNLRQQRINFSAQPIAAEGQRKYQLINPRQVQKQKLQNKYAQQQFGIGSNSRQKDQRRNLQFENPRKQPPQREPPIRDNFIGNQVLNKKKSEKQFDKIQNPFLKNEQLLKDKRQSQERNYRRLLEEQMEQQRRRKEQQKQKYKQENQQKFNSYTPLIQSSPTNEEKPAVQNQVKKKRDPNAQYTTVSKPSSQIRPSDLQFMRLQVDDFRNKLRKGRINHEEYDMHIKKLETHYKCKINELFGQYNNQIYQNKPQNNEKNPNQQIQKQNKQQNILKSNSNIAKNISGFEQIEKKQQQRLMNKNKSAPSNEQANNYYNNTSVPIEAMGPRYQMPNNYSHFYQPPVVMPTNPQSEMQMQMMLKLFEELKGIIKMQSQNQMSIINDKRVLQETISKLNPFMVQNPNHPPIMFTQQVPASHHPQAKQYYSDAKKYQKFQQFPKHNIQATEYSNPQSSESEISSSYIQKSLSGVVNKIPLTKKQKQQQKIDPGKEIAKFYQRKYKIKGFKGFQYKEVDNQSSFVIPSVSNFLQTKNSQNQLSEAFERDLRNYKKLQKQRDLLAMKQKIKKNKEGYQVEQKKSQNIDNFQTNKSKTHKYQSLNVEQAPNPFLKKHISNESNPPLNSKNDEFRNMISSPTSKSPQILQQYEYQTQPRKSESPTNNPNQKLRSKKNQAQISQNNKQNSQHGMENRAENSKQYPSSRIMNIMKANNEILSKYQLTPSRVQNSNIQSNSLSSIKQMVRAEESKDISSREYFSGHDISPVQRREYESSLETVRSEEESARYERKNNMDMLMGGSSQHRSSAISSYYSPMPPMQSVHQSPTIQSIEVEKRQIVSGNNRYYEQQRQEPNITGYSQTVQSIDQSSSKLPSFQKPPNNNTRKNPRSASRKKESVIKTGNSDNFQKSGLSGIPSQGSKQKSSSLLKPPSYEQENPSGSLESPRFDSAIYESAYQQSVGARGNHSKIGANPSQIKYQVKLVPSTFKQVLRQDPSQRESGQKQKDLVINKEQQIKNESNAKQNSSMNSISSKWKSLQQARKLAKQFRQRSGQDHNRSSVEQKLSELQSYLHTNKKDESVIQAKSRKQQYETTNKKKDIMKILDDLGEQDYAPDFQSYKQESER